ncbi:helix-turn-helix transcriptional regulator [Paenibacillus silagei]|uniref:DNA-binding transcriptional regulator YafY n=1 Tax=Paenibacillus silagei TaxID=1670801 RepID=A0ABS4NVM0_9BACL|nr:WYL domain-containing protein [Paenibacillus silagei]MBP2114108.1 putative DNA-binding transcriptional regulator YafY [Paenibacillus silagei]
MNNSGKNGRVLAIYTRLCDGAVINKQAEAVRYGVNERSIQRDIEDIRDFLEQRFLDEGLSQAVIFDKSLNGYRLERVNRALLSNSEVLAICKIMLESRAFTRQELMPMLDKLLECCLPKNAHKPMTELIANEKFHYVEPQHKTVFGSKLWDIGKAVKENRILQVDYQRVKGKAVVQRRLQPVAILFSEYYFYLAAYIDKKTDTTVAAGKQDPYPTIYRIDRMIDFQVLDERFTIPYKDRFEEGEFRKRVQFMYGGDLQVIKFRFKGESVEAVLDRLPTAKVLDETDGIYTISAEVFGKGIDMWLRSQGDLIELC